MSKIWFSAAVGAALLAFPGVSWAQHGGHESVQHSGRDTRQTSPQAPSHAANQQSPNRYSGYGRGSYGGYGRGYYGPGFGLYIGPSYRYAYPYYGGYYGSPYYGGYYYSQPSYNYVEPSYNYAQPSYGYVEPSMTSPYSYPVGTASANPAEDLDPNAAMVEVRVPENAEIWFAGARTTQTGPVRHFVSPSLQPGRTFSYEVRARWTDASGRPVDRTKEVKVQAGGRVGVDFNRS